MRRICIKKKSVPLGPLITVMTCWRQFFRTSISVSHRYWYHQVLDTRPFLDITPDPARLLDIRLFLDITPDPARLLDIRPFLDARPFLDISPDPARLKL